MVKDTESTKCLAQARENRRPQSRAIRTSTDKGGAGAGDGGDRAVRGGGQRDRLAPRLSGSKH